MDEVVGLFRTVCRQQRAGRDVTDSNAVHSCCILLVQTYFKKNGERTRGHSQKLFKKRARLDQKKNFFPVKIVGKWNDLPANVVEAATIGSFKRRLMNHRRSLVTS